jgi:hypothetical protein
MSVNGTVVTGLAMMVAVTATGYHQNAPGAPTGQSIVTTAGGSAGTSVSNRGVSPLKDLAPCKAISADEATQLPARSPQGPPDTPDSNSQGCSWNFGPVGADATTVGLTYRSKQSPDQVRQNYKTAKETKPRIGDHQAWLLEQPSIGNTPVPRGHLLQRGCGWRRRRQLRPAEDVRHGESDRADR